MKGDNKKSPTSSPINEGRVIPGSFSLPSHTSNNQQQYQHSFTINTNHQQALATINACQRPSTLINNHHQSTTTIITNHHQSFTIITNQQQALTNHSQSSPVNNNH
jgi:hypothetical protein